MQSFYFFTAAFACSQILLSLAKILSFKNLHISEFLFASFLICIGVYLTQPLFIGEQYNNPRFIVLIWQHLPTAIPALFLFCCATIFNDGFQFKVIYITAALLTFIPPLLFDIFSLSGSLAHLLFSTIPQGIEFILMAIGLWFAGISWKNDLIENRRRFRLLVMGSAGSIILIVISAQQLSLISDHQLDILHYPIACLFLICLNMLLLDVTEDTLIFRQAKEAKHLIIQGTSPQQGKKVNEGIENTTQSKEFKALTALMEEQKVFLQEALTVSELAKLLEIPEYKTRKLINHHLGYRNFNEFLNHYRVREACLLLEDSKDSVTNIANTVGYNAISAFNRAFKDIHAITPSEYRKNIKNP